MLPIHNLHGLFLEQLKFRYDSELQQIESFPELIERASSPTLKKIIGKSIKGSERHLAKLEELLTEMHTDPLDELCESSIILINETWKLMSRATNPEVTDAALITAIQHIHHHDIAGYGTLRAFAKALELAEYAQILQVMLEDEKILDQELKDLAIQYINIKALDKKYGAQEAF